MSWDFLEEDRILGFVNNKNKQAAGFVRERKPVFTI